MRRLTVTAIAVGLIGLSLATTLWIRPVRALVKSIVRPEPPAQITPLAITLPATPTAPPATSTAPPPTTTPRPQPTRAVQPSPTTTPPPTATSSPTATPTRGPVEVGGRRYTAYIPAATKPGQFFQYSCEFDAAWVILTTYGLQVSSDELINGVAHDRSIEPYLTETSQGVVIHGGDITRAFSGDYTNNYLARGTSGAFRPLFERYGLRTTPVHDRAALEAALRRGELVWLKTTVDFKPWRPATWVMPDGRTFHTVLGNDHAVVAMGFSERGVVIRDVLGPTSTNRQRPYEYEVPWEVFMAAWGAQSYDGLAVAPPAPDA